MARGYWSFTFQAVRKPAHVALGAPDEHAKESARWHGGSMLRALDTGRRCPPPQPKGAWPAARQAASPAFLDVLHRGAAGSLPSTQLTNAATRGGFWTAWLLSLLASSMTAAAPLQDAPFFRTNADPARVYRTVEQLSASECEGRLARSEGYMRAARLMAESFRKNGLHPLAPDYLQSFPCPHTKLHKLTLEVQGADGKSLEAKMFKDYAPMLFCGSGKVESNIVFAGFGMTSEAHGWDDYKGLDVAGKVVLVLRGTPKAKANEVWTDVDTHRHRAENARKHGATGMLYIYLPVANPNGDYVPGFPMAMVSEGFGERILASAGLDLKTLKRVLTTRQPVSLATDVKVRLEAQSQHFPETKTANVLAWIPGSDPKLRGEAVVLGAHLDHCGAWPSFMPGADDDASGVASVMEAARLLAASPVKPRRSIVFLLSSSEEVDVRGAGYFVEHKPKEIARFHFMAFLDVMGAGNGVHVYGLKAEPGREAAFQGIVKELGLGLKLDGDDKLKVKNGDHYHFQIKEVPAVGIFGNGPHETYHTDRDDLYKFTPKLSLEAAQLAALLVLRKANE